MGLSIQHAFSGAGEKKIGKYFLDGYIEWESNDELVTTGYEYFGCRFHSCPFNCGTASVQTEEQRVNEIARIEYLDRVLTRLKVIYGCQWKKIKESLRKKNEKIESKVCSFLTRPSVLESEILEAVKSESFYGLLRVDISTPSEVIQKYRKMNFPLIFNHLDITEDLLSPEMLKLAQDRNYDFPRSAKTLTWNAKGFIACTPLLRFYMELGMEISNLQWALQYEKACPFSDFVNSLVEVRIAAKKDGNGPLGDRAKFVLNSAVGEYSLSPC